MKGRSLHRPGEGEILVAGSIYRHDERNTRPGNRELRWIVSIKLLNRQCALDITCDTAREMTSRSRSTFRSARICLALSVSAEDASLTANDRICARVGVPTVSRSGAVRG